MPYTYMSDILVEVTNSDSVLKKIGRNENDRMNFSDGSYYFYTGDGESRSRIQKFLNRQ